MRDEIRALIESHKIGKLECKSLLEELNQIDDIKLSYQEDIALKELKSRYSEEYAWRGVIIGQLEDLL